MKTINSNFTENPAAIEDFIWVELTNDTYSLERYLGDSETVVIPDEVDGCAVSSISDGAFCKNSRVKNVIIPESVEFIGEYAFAWCSSLKSVKIPDCVKVIERRAFKNC